MNDEPSINESVTGYAHADYAASLAEFGEPRLLPRSSGWILQRTIPDSNYSDGMGCYPLFACRDWSRLAGDLEELSETLICLSLVTDPFGDYDQDYLKHCFPEVAAPFKEHYVIDIRQPFDVTRSPHRRNVLRGLRETEVERCAHPGDYLDDWIELYSNLVRRHEIAGMTAFSRSSFEAQFKVPGLVAFRAVRDDVTVGMVLWYAQGNRAYYHLGAYSQTGYEHRASFALFSRSIEYFATRGLQWLNLGAGAGVGTGAASGLNRFKQGWSNGTRTAFFCGRIFNQKLYQQLSAAWSTSPANYFPAYRAGEFS